MERTDEALKGLELGRRAGMAEPRRPDSTSVSAIRSSVPAGDPDSPLERALHPLGGAIKGRLLTNKDGRQVPAT